ncbi:hypothetical protein ACK3Y0_01000 [Aeromonas caviae]|nr:hypothetical protein [Aeromonas caviae]MDU7579146.1 hypothetical protein [Aeromonas sp.]MDX7844251.1 hypothetical protein [Aeromonas caviae]MDX7850323.1 hypothetical protein [Aeromonas caviae]
MTSSKNRGEAASPQGTLTVTMMGPVRTTWPGRRVGESLILQSVTWVAAE